MTRDGGVGWWSAAPPPQNLGNLNFLGRERNLGKAKSAQVYVRVFFLFQERYFSFCICNRVGQRTIKDINFTRIFKVSTKLPESRRDVTNTRNGERGTGNGERENGSLGTSVQQQPS